MGKHLKITPLLKLWLGVLVVVLVQGCASKSTDSAKSGSATQTAQATSYGAAIHPEGALPVAHLPRLLQDRDSAEVKVVGIVLESCRVKGCWMQVNIPDQPPLRVTFQDYAFFVPTDLHGQTVVLEGTAHWRTTSVADLQHYAEDAGKPAEAIAAITAPEQTLTLIARGVIIQE